MEDKYKKLVEDLEKEGNDLIPEYLLIEKCSEYEIDISELSLESSIDDGNEKIYDVSDVIDVLRGL